MIKRLLNYVFIILILFAMLVCVDPDTLIDSENSLIVVPFIPVKVSIVVFAVTLFGILLAFTNGRIKVDYVFFLLAIRSLLYFIPTLQFKDSYSLGTILAVIQCCLLYFIGLNFKGKFKNILKILIVFSLIIIGEEVYVLLYRNISIVSSELKWFMVLPLGRYNYLTCYLLPILFLVDSYYKDKKFLKLRVLYTLIILFGILATGSKLAFLIFSVYFAVKFIRILFKFRLKTANGLYVLCGMIVVFAVMIFGIVLLAKNSSIITRYFELSTFEPRLKVYSEGFQLFMENPLFGRGSSSYQIYDAESAHNFLLEALIQTGIIGTVIYMACLVIVIRTFVKAKNKKVKLVALTFCLSVLIQGLAEVTLFGLRFDTFFWFLIGFFVQKSRDSMKTNYNYLF